jgi:hypothetical protein
MADQQQGKGRPTGAGSEASEGIHGANEGRDEGEKTSVSSDRAGADRKKGSEPLDEADRSNEHRSGYGGSGGAPVTSSDQRESHGKAKQ